MTNEWFDLLPENIQKTAETLVQCATTASKPVCPPPELIFRALDLVSPGDVKVCIVGQDPYHTPGVANGLAFSVAPEAPLQPSLKKIFQELVNDVQCDYPKSGDLMRWSENGALLLNTALTVYEHEPNSHSSWGWPVVTKSILKLVAKMPQPVVFLLWGANAQNLRSSILPNGGDECIGGIEVDAAHKKAIIMSSHPSPFSASRSCGKTPPFIGSRPFTRANKLLVEMGGTPMDWNLN